MTIQTRKTLHSDHINAVGIQKMGKSTESHAAWNISRILKDGKNLMMQKELK